MYINTHRIVDAEIKTHFEMQCIGYPFTKEWHKQAIGPKSICHRARYVYYSSKSFERGRSNIPTYSKDTDDEQVRGNQIKSNQIAYFMH
jgi:hypothetical protein